MSRYQKSSNPFEDEDDERDFVMVGKNSTSQSSSYSSNSKTSSVSGPNERRIQRPNMYSPYSSSNDYHTEESSPFESKREQLSRKIALSENNQLESTQRALASIYDSEAMGVATAEELLRQGETLNNIEKKTDSMQQDLKTTQRHLNNIKSVFGGIKNWWNKDKKPAENSKTSEENSSTRLQSAIDKSTHSMPDVKGFYDDDDDNDLDSKFMAGAHKPGSVGGGYKVISPVTRSAREEEVDQNLVLMADGMSILKGLAMGLGDEIEKQNEQLDRINVKVEATDDLIGNQNTQMRKILKK